MPLSALEGQIACLFDQMKNSGDYCRRKGSEYCQSCNMEQKRGDTGTGELLW